MYKILSVLLDQIDERLFSLHLWGDVSWQMIDSALVALIAGQENKFSLKLATKYYPTKSPSHKTERSSAGGGTTQASGVKNEHVGCVCGTLVTLQVWHQFPFVSIRSQRVFKLSVSMRRNFLENEKSCFSAGEHKHWLLQPPVSCSPRGEKGASMKVRPELNTAGPGGEKEGWGNERGWTEGRKTWRQGKWLMPLLTVHTIEETLFNCRQDEHPQNFCITKENVTCFIKSPTICS